MRMKMETLSDEMRDLAEPRGVLNQEGLQCEKERKKKTKETAMKKKETKMKTRIQRRHGEMQLFPRLTG